MKTTETQQVTLPETGCSNARNMQPEKELSRAASVVSTTGDELVTARWYMSRSASASVVYCSLWVRSPGMYTSGHGQAGGGNYCKMSAAFDAACWSAGLTLTEDVSGRGESMVRETLTAIAEALGAESTVQVWH